MKKDLKKLRLKIKEAKERQEKEVKHSEVIKEIEKVGKEVRKKSEVVEVSNFPKQRARRLLQHHSYQRA